MYIYIYILKVKRLRIKKYSVTKFVLAYNIRNMPFHNRQPNSLAQNTFSHLFLIQSPEKLMTILSSQYNQPHQTNPETPIIYFLQQTASPPLLSQQAKPWPKSLLVLTLVASERK